MSKFKVVTTFCDDVIQDHEHSVLIAATKEYANKVAEAIEPTMEHPEARHVRQIEFMALDDDGNQEQYTSAGPFGCADRPVEVDA